MVHQNLNIAVVLEAGPFFCRLYMQRCRPAVVCSYSNLETLLGTFVSAAISNTNATWREIRAAVVALLCLPRLLLFCPRRGAHGR